MPSPVLMRTPGPFCARSAGQRVRRSVTPAAAAGRCSVAVLVGLPAALMLLLLLLLLVVVLLLLLLRLLKGQRGRMLPCL